MKILLYSANFAPEPVGIGKYSGEMAAWLAAQGHSVRVVCAPPYYPDWKLDPSYRFIRRWRETWQSVDVWRAPLWVPHKPGGLSRIVHLLSFALSSLPLMMRQVLWRPDVVFTVAPALMCAPTGKLVAWLCGAKSWLHIQDFEVEVAFQMGLLKGRRLHALVRCMERTVLRRFDVTSSISRKMVELLTLKGVAPERCYSFPNWVDASHIHPLDAPSTYRSKLNIAVDAVVVLFSGSLGSKQDLMLIPEVARAMQHLPELVFVVCGDGVMKPTLEAAAKNLPNIRMLPLQPFAHLNDLLGLADIHLLTQSADAEDLVLPSKLGGMLASGRPVIATCNTETEIADIVNLCGLCVAPGNARELAIAIHKLLSQPAERRRLGAQARRCALELFDQNTVLQHMQTRLTTITGTPA